MLETAKCILNGQQYDRKTGLVNSFEMDVTKRPVGVVVSDVRFHNELAAIKDAGGRLVRVKRPETDEESSKTGIAKHASEMEQKHFKDVDFDAILQNRGTLSELFNVLDVVVTQWE
jgi:hypothetical protein